MRRSSGNFTSACDGYILTIRSTPAWNARWMVVASRGYSGGGGGAGGSRRGASRQLKTATRLPTGRASTTGEYWPPFAVFLNRSARNFGIEVWWWRAEDTRPGGANGRAVGAGWGGAGVMQ